MLNILLSSSVRKLAISSFPFDVEIPNLEMDALVFGSTEKNKWNGQV
jgi:hypothetical protein